jgi:hypothetical protein
MRNRRGFTNSVEARQSPYPRARLFADLGPPDGQNRQQTFTGKKPAVDESLASPMPLRARDLAQFSDAAGLLAVNKATEL